MTSELDAIRSRIDTLLALLDSAASTQAHLIAVVTNVEKRLTKLENATYDDDGK